MPCGKPAVIYSRASVLLLNTALRTARAVCLEQTADIARVEWALGTSFWCSASVLDYWLPFTCEIWRRAGLGGGGGAWRHSWGGDVAPFSARLCGDIMRQIRMIVDCGLGRRTHYVCITSCAICI